MHDNSQLTSEDSLKKESQVDESYAHLINTGILSFRTSEISALERVIICGLPRSGTTAMASVFEELGLSVGKSVSNVKEDVRFRGALQANNYKQTLATYSKNRAADTPDGNPWAAKFPEAYLSLEKISEVYPASSTAIIVLMRDPLSVALRNHLSVYLAAKHSVWKATQEYQDCVKACFNEKLACPLIMVSYEKLLATPERVIRSTLDLLKLTFSDELIAKSVGSISVDNTNYLKESHLHLAYNIDSKGPDGIKGWCYLEATPARTVRLEVITKEKKVLCSFLCDKPRPDVLESGKHPTGQCGFELQPNDFTPELKSHLSEAGATIELVLGGSSRVL